MTGSCYKCLCLNVCLSAALDNELIKCIDFGEFKRFVDECVDKINEIPLEYLLSHEEIKELVIGNFKECD